MTTEVSTNTHYRLIATSALETSVELHNILDANYKKMNECKGTAIWYLESVLYLTEKEKRNALEQSLTHYDTFIKTQQCVERLFKALESSVQNCKQEPANDSPEYQALQTISSHLDELKARVQNVFIPLFNRRLGEVASTLDLLIGSLRPNLAGMRLGGYRTPALNAAYEIWTKDRTVLFDSSKPIEEAQPTALNQALDTLELSEWSLEKEISPAGLFDDGKEEANISVDSESTPSSLNKRFVMIPEGSSDIMKETNMEIGAASLEVGVDAKEQDTFDKLEQLPVNTNQKTSPNTWAEVVRQSKEKNV